MPKSKMRQIATAGIVPPLAPDGPIVIGTDAAADYKRASGAYLATTGHYGARAHPYPSDISGAARIAVAELRAVLWAIQAVTEHSGRRPLTVLTDSQEALGYLRAWQKGSDRMPEGYRISWRANGDQPALVTLQWIAEYTPGLTFTHVKGHDGHPLNEAADSLAKLTLRSSRGLVGSERVAELAPQWAQQNLAAMKKPRPAGR